MYTEPSNFILGDFMAYAIDKNTVIAGFVNTHKDKTEFDLNDIYDYILSLWNAGVGPIRLNFTKIEMKYYLEACVGVCLQRTSDHYYIDKSLLNDKMSKKEANLLNNNKELAKSFDLWCRLQVDLRTPRMLLDAMGYKFLYK